MIDLTKPPEPYSPGSRASAVGVDPSDFVSLWEYFSQVFVPQNRIELPLKEEHRQVCDALQDAFLGELPEGIEFVVINMPPRVGKTKTLEAFVSWGFAYFPDSQWIYTSYSGDIAEKSLAYIARTLRESWFIDLFGDLVHGSKSDHLSTIDGGNAYAEGTGGSLTGKGAGLKRPAGGALIIDDASKPNEALSPVESKAKQQWVETTCKNRRNSDRWCPIIIVGQRLGPDDVPGYFLANYRKKCLHIKIPALVDSATGKASNADDAVSRFAETVSTQTLLDYRKTRVGRFVLASQYQQEPTALGGNLIPIGSFHHYDPSTALATKWERLVITIDTALKIKQANDYSAAALWGLHKGKAYLIDLLHGKWESPELVENVATFWAKWSDIPGWPRPRMVIEEKAAGTPLLQTLNRRGIPAIGIERDIDKVRRVQSILPFVETGMVVIPASGSTPWIEKWETEHAQFSPDGKHAHDDMVDTTVDGVEQLLGKGLSIFDVLGRPGRPGAKLTPDQQLKAAVEGPRAIADSLEKYVAYLRNVGKPIAIAKFDEDWTPIGPTIRAQLKTAKRAAEMNGLITHLG